MVTTILILISSIFMKLIDEEKIVNLVDNDIVGKIKSLPFHEDVEANKIICRRNYAILKLTNSAEDGEDANGDIWVEYYLEDSDQILEKFLHRRWSTAQ